jgi:serine/threonine protein phosphatase 1
MNDSKEPIYIIGDVHGCYKTLLALIEQFPNKQNSKICFVGDLIDRGSNSKAVIDFVRDNKYDCVLGNHEKYFIEYSQYLEKKLSYFDIKSWFGKNGGKETINSYKVNGILDEIKLLDHSKWLQSLPLYLEYKDMKIKNRYLVVSHSHVFDKWKYKNYPRDSKEYISFENTVLNSRFKNYDNL